MEAEPAGGAAPQASPFSRKWVDAPGAGADGAGSAPQLRTLTFNILAESLARGSSRPPDAADRPCPTIFEDEGTGGVAYLGSGAKCTNTMRFSCSSDVLVWGRRWPLLRSLILELEPDVIGLQEVDLLAGGRDRLNAHDQEIRNALSNAGYDGTFARKTGSAGDGLALFWRRSRLKTTSRAETWGLGTNVHVALAQPLCLDGAWELTAVTTHLKAGLTQQAEDARTQQATVLMEHLKEHPEVVLLADLNAHCRPLAFGGFPEKPSGRDAWVEKPGAYALFTEHLQSAYQAVLGDEPSFTCWNGWVDREVRLVCDYIFLKGALLQPRRVLNVPDAAEILQYPERLPNAAYPSDHCPLVADLAVVVQGDHAAGQGPAAPTPPRKQARH